MRILVDIGNSRCKAAIEDADGLHALEAFPWHNVFLHEVLERVWLEPLGGRVPESVIVSNVAGDKLLPNLSAWCSAKFGVEPIAVVSTAEFQGLKNAYKEPSTFGVDRWAAIIGARSMYSGALCVIDSGSATTVDVISAEGQHMGGAIMPGIYTMRRSLGKYTAALFAADGDIAPFSNNTASGIAGGTGFASVGALDRFVMEASRLVDSVTTLVTGGESEILESMMVSDVIREPMLVLKGVSVLGGSMSLQQISSRSRCPDLPVN